MNRRARRLYLFSPLALAVWLTSCDTDAESSASLHPEEARLRPIFHLADSLRTAMSLTESTREYVRLEDSLARASDTAGMWRARLWLADIQIRKGDLDSAHRDAEAALRLAGGDLRREGWARFTRSRAYWQEGNFPDALTDAEWALDAARTSGDRNLENTVYQQLGRIYSLQGRHRDALAVHEQSLALLDETGANPRAYASAFNEIGIDYRRLGRYDEARRAYEEALTIYREADDHYGVAMIQYNRSNVLRSVGNRAGAFDALLESLERNRMMELSPRGLSFVHEALASLNLELGNVDQARLHYDSALVWNEAASHPFGVTGALESRGRLETSEGEYATAELLLLRSLAIADSAGYGTHQATVREAMARLRIEQGNAADAVRLARRAASIADNQDDPEIEIQTLETLAKALEAAGERDQALRTNERAIDLLESWRGRLALGDQRRGVSDPRLAAYEATIRLLAQNGEAAASLEMAERTRARLLLELMALHPQRADSGSEVGEFHVRLEEAFASRTSVDGVAREALDRVIEAMADTLAQLEKAARVRDPVGGAARYPRPTSFDGLRTVLLQPGRTLLSYFWGEDAVYGWRASFDGVEVARLGEPDEINGLIDFLREAVFRSERSVDWEAPARRAYDILVAPLGPSLEDDLFIVPSGPLGGLPFEVLQPPNGPPLGAHLRIVYGPSASVLETLAATPLEPMWDRGVLAVGDPRPSYAAGEEFGRLPFAAQEARAVASLDIGANGDALIGRRATVERWLQSAASYRYLHFGAHAVVDEQRVDRTYIVLSDAPLDLATIQRTPLSAELVTLSACESALGRHLGGEGIVGLVHAFLSAGARGVLVTLWRVPDQVAHDFTVALYKELAAGVAPPDAVFNVRRAWIQEGRDPSDWAGFVLVGGLHSNS